MENKRISRRILRGAPLTADCLKAHTTSHEFGADDNRVFCYGIMDCMTDELIDDCRICAAYVGNAKPIKGEG